MLSPHSKLWYHICSQVVKQWWAWSCGFNMTCSRSQRSDCSPLHFLFRFFSAKCVLFVINHTTKLGMKDLLKDQQLWVERDSNQQHLANFSKILTDCVKPYQSCRNPCRVFHTSWNIVQPTKMNVKGDTVHNCFRLMNPRKKKTLKGQLLPWERWKPKF